MEQHPVPQNVTTFQFRLIGDMTLKQFGYLAAGAILGYVCYKLPLPFVFTWPLAMLSLLAGFGFAFVPVEERPMDVWVLSFFKSVYSPTQYLWQRGRPAPEPPQATAAPTPRAAPPVPAPAPVAAKIPTASPIAASPGPPAPPVAAAAAVPTPKAIPPAVPTPKAIPPAVKPVARRQAGILELIKQWLRLLTVKFKPNPRVVVAPRPIPIAPPPAPRPVVSPPVRPPVPFVKPRLRPKPSPAPPPRPAPARRPRGEPFAWLKDWFQPRPRSPVMQTRRYADVFAGAPLPGDITGKRLEVPSASGAAQVAPASAQPQHKLVTEAQEQITSLEDKLSELQKELQTKSMTEARLLELQQQLTELLSQRNKMEQELMDLRRKLTAQPAAQAVVRPATVAPLAPTRPTVRVITAEGTLRAGLPRLTIFPNVVTGLIKDGENNLLPGVLVTVRDKEDMPLRAFKTNKLGQFAASTPLPNGTYFMEVEDPRGRFAFDRIQISLNGTVMPAIEIIAKSQRELTRAKLEKEIFGAQKM